MTGEVRWNAEIDSLMFSVDEHAAFCAVHRFAFRTLIGTEPTPAGCFDYFRGHEHAFRAAAAAKIAEKALPMGRNFHLTSRDIARTLLQLEPKQKGEH